MVVCSRPMSRDPGDAGLLGPEEPNHVSGAPRNRGHQLPGNPAPEAPTIQIALLLGLVVLATLISPFRRELLVGDETKYSRVVQQMIENDSYIVLTKDGEIYGHKPPLHFWAIAFLSRAFGLESIWPFVLPSLIAFGLTLIVVARWQSQLFGREGPVAAFVFATFWLAWGTAQSARMDMTFALLISVAATQYWRHRETQGWGPAIKGGLACGVAVLVKGPMAIVILGSLILIESIRTRCMPSRAVVAGGVIAAVIPVVWLVAAVRYGGAEYGRELVFRQTIGRAFGSWVHGEPVWFFFGRFPLTFFPWFLVLLIALFVVFRGEREGPEGETARFISSWFVAAFLPFSFVSSKLDVYMLPAMVPGSILVAWILLRQDFGARFSGWIRKGFRALTVLLALVACLVTVGLIVTRHDANPDLEIARDSRVVVVLVLSAVLSLAGYWMIRKRESFRESGLVFGIVALVPVMGLVGLATPVINQAASTSPLVDALVRSEVPGEEITLYWTPHLWVRGMPADLHRVSYLESPVIGSPTTLIVVRRDKAVDLGDVLLDYRVADSVRMIGKEFDVYQRK